MKMRQVVWLGLLSLVGCASIANTGPATGSNDGPNSGQLETLYGIDIKPDKIWFQVRSTGCTSAESFSLAVDSQGSSTRVTLLRQAPDRCRGMPRLVAVELSLSPSERGQGPIRIGNPFDVKPARQKSGR